MNRICFLSVRVAAFGLMLSISLIAAGQNCNQVNNLTSFHGLKFGARIPDSVSKHLQFFLGSWSLDYADVKNNPKAAYAKKLFRFGKNYEEFENLLIHTTNDRKLLSVYISTPLTYGDSLQLANGNPPSTMEKFRDRLREMFGRETEEGPHEDKFLGSRQYQYIWECDRMKLVLQISVNEVKKGMNYVSIELLDKEAEKKYKLYNITGE